MVITSTETVRDSQNNVVDRKVDTKHLGALTITTVTQLGDEFTSNESGVVVSNRAHTYQNYPAITKVFATGAGEISTEDQRIGKTTVTKTVRVSNADEDTEVGGDVLQKKVEARDGYYLVTETTRDKEEGVVDRRVETKNKGALTIITVTQLGTDFDATETGVEISSRDHTYQDMPAVTKVFAQGSGTISTENKSRSDSGYDYGAPVWRVRRCRGRGINVLLKRVDSKDGYYLITETTRPDSDAIVDSKTETKNQGALIISTVTQLGEWTANVSGVEISERSHT